MQNCITGTLDISGREIPIRPVEFGDPHPRLPGHERAAPSRIARRHDLSPDRYIWSCPVRDPSRINAAAVRDLPPSTLPEDGGGNARTYTTYFPDSFDTYARPHPSGENVELASLKVFLWNCPAFPLSTGLSITRLAQSRNFALQEKK